MLTENEKKVLRQIMINFNKVYSINQLAKQIALTPYGTYKILKKFEKEGILKYRNISNIKTYYLNFENEKTEKLLSFSLIPKTNKKIEYRKEDFKPLRKIAMVAVIFGSYISKKESNDIDILFILNKRDFKNYKTILNKVQEIVPVKIHDVVQTKKDLEENLKKGNETLLEALKGIILWGEDILVEVIKNVS